MDEFLKMENITKKFGSMYANRNVTLSIAAGEVHTLLGENGAGKSTLMNILMGIYEPTEGSIYFKGEKVKIDSPLKAAKIGIGMVHQHFMLVEAMSVFENIILGVKDKNSIFIKKEACKKQILEISNKYGLEIDLEKGMDEISVGEQQRVEIIKALYKGAQLLILDEPTAVLTDLEVEGLFEIIQKLTKEGKSVIFISHKMREVLKISDRITILRAGEAVQTLFTKETNADELASLMIGHPLEQKVYDKVEHSSDIAMHLEDVSYQKEMKHSGLNEITLDICKGEILGIAGVDGNGQSQLAQLLTGVIRPEEGTLQIKDTVVKKISPKAFMKEKIAHIPEDRNKMGLIGNMSVEENLMLKKLDTDKVSYAHGWFLRKRKMMAYAKELKETYDIRCASLNQEARNLSGGNQQKIILAREIEEEPNMLVAVHPSRGLDIGATGFVHDNIVHARDNGCAVVLISADFDEILKLSDRIAVMFEGEIIGIFDGKNPPIHDISLAMTGKSKS